MNYLGCPVLTLIDSDTLSATVIQLLLTLSSGFFYGIVLLFIIFDSRSVGHHLISSTNLNLERAENYNLTV